jgi:hypothetical protein
MSYHSSLIDVLLAEKVEKPTPEEGKDALTTGWISEYIFQTVMQNL